MNALSLHGAHRFCIAPMMDWTDRHCRFFHRQLTQHALLYTEMVTAAAIHYGDRERLLGFDAAERPLALQIGGSEPALLVEAAKWGEDFGYDEINLNVGCPSDRVQEGRFGACLMAEPLVVADCVHAMMSAVRLPVTVKCRIGIDDQDDDADLERFVSSVAEAGCRVFIVHARKAWLSGLSPKENREIPPLDHQRVYRLKLAHPELTIVVNGGVETLDQAAAHLARVDGAMLGRAAYHSPWMLNWVDARFFASAGGAAEPDDIVELMKPYISAQLAKGVPLNRLTRHMLGLFHGRPGGKHWRRVLSEEAHRRGAGLEVLDHAVQAMNAHAGVRLHAAE